MKKKLILGLGLVACIFIVSGIIILASLTELSRVTDLNGRQQRTVTNYDRMLYLVNADQSELYAFEAGYKRDLNSIRSNVRETKSLLSSIREEYKSYSSRTTCKYCHFLKDAAAGSLERLDHHERTLKGIFDRLAEYEQKILRIADLKDALAARPIVKEAARDSEEIETQILSVRNEMEKMNESLEQLELTRMRRSTYVVTLAIALSILLSIVVVIMMLRSITGPMNKLIHGLEKVSSGDYGSKVNILSKDEFGFLAQTFNKMTDNLSEVTMQKETLLNELTDLNSDLDRRVQEAIAELSTAHEMVLRNETLSAVGAFASGVAHELATPLASILTYFQMVKTRIPEGDNLAADVQIIETELKRCNTILRGMLNFARAPEKEKTPTNINAIVHDLLALVRYQPAYKRTIAIKEDLPSGVPMIPAVPGQLRQVFMNVILNALKAMPGGGTLSVSTSVADDGRRVVVNISDTGHGIPRDDLDRIFQPFYTGRETGTGLGLSISYGIIKGHGGEMEVKSVEGRGTTFFIYLPVSSDASLMTAPVAAEDAEFKGARG